MSRSGFVGSIVVRPLGVPRQDVVRHDPALSAWGGHSLRLYVGSMRVELVHEWLTNLAGSEKVVGALRRTFPGASVNTSMFYAPEFPGWDRVHTTFLQPFARGPASHLRVLPLLPLAMHSLRVPTADLVITDVMMPGMKTG